MSPGVKKSGRPEYCGPTSSTTPCADAYAESTTTGPIDGSLPTVMSTLPPPIDSPIVATRARGTADRKSTRLNSSHQIISYAVFCLKKKHSTDIPSPCLRHHP